MADVESQRRPARPDEAPAWHGAMSAAFGEELAGAYLDNPAPVAELDRSLGLWDGDRIVATSGIYTRVLTVPGAVVPCAGITWITVAPTHRRRGVLTAIMRRQLDDIRAAEREPVAALWAAEASIYGRFGYAPATRRGGWTGRTQELRFRPGVDVGTGSVRPAQPDEFRAAAVPLHEQLRRWVPGNLARDERWWDRFMMDEPEERKGRPAKQLLLHTEAD